ncbi:Calcium-transporting ATPase [Luteitalea pratensis]|uniref:P-type Cu(+) transporter n=1 Tax=Luteitalea pratensis TaxID=1855912 RepID=A0A143PI22_LUTPR|nr:HAD-IC family P-type ATPase [Luteitalea pratensis]AMY07910.1 Calcium-transporting ATPase [Luteitalea pratensis]
MSGLSTADAVERLGQFGPNALPEQAPEPLWQRFLRQFNSPLIFILLFALTFDLGLWAYEGGHGWPIEAAAIGLILLFNAALGLYQEQRSEAALARLKVLAGAQAWVLRDGEFVRLPTQDLVPGDCVRLESGDRVPADGVLRDPRGAMLDESILTGESVPVDKGQDDEAFSGTLLVRGKTLLEVTRTGPLSAMGRLATMLGDIELSKTPLERRVDVLGRRIARWVLTLTALLGVAGVIAEGLSRAPQMIIFAVALAVAAVPEGLPAVLTVALALGVERMARHRAVVRRLSAVEALGSVTVIATDKTGTLTENRMDVRSIDAPDLGRALVAVALANDADPSTGAGDPLDAGLLRYACAHGIDVARLRQEHPVISERPFDSAWKFARVTVREDGHRVSFLKGAPEVVVARCDLSVEDRESWTGKAEAYAEEGFRVLAIASAPGEAEEHLSLLGLALFWDPPRPEVPKAVRTALDAGIRVVMITGDHPVTALAIAHQIGIPGVRVLTGEDLAEYERHTLHDALTEVNVFARVRPEQKLLLVESLQALGQIVAMTGDGVNDAPALKRSDVGVAMGQRGSDVSREVADLVLLDDNFATVVSAVEEGRGIYENIQKFLRFLFSTNLSEVLLVAGGAVVAFSIDLRDAAGHLVLPLTAAQILWINLLTDGLPALALAFDRTPGVMQQKPRPAGSPLLDQPSVRFVVAVGSMKAVLALAVLGILPTFGYSLEVTRAAAFHFMAIGQLFLTYPSRHTWMRPLSNPYLHAAVVGGVGIQIAAASIPFVSNLLGSAALPVEVWAVVFAAAFGSWALSELISRLVWRQVGQREA